MQGAQKERGRALRPTRAVGAEIGREMSRDNGAAAPQVSRYSSHFLKILQKSLHPSGDPGLRPASGLHRHSASRCS